MMTDTIQKPRWTTRFNRFEYLEQNKKTIIIRFKVACAPGECARLMSQEFSTIEDANSAYRLLSKIYNNQ